MSDVIVSEKTIAWVKLLHEKGATTVDADGNVAYNDVVDDAVDEIHAKLAGGKSTEGYKELQEAYQAAKDEVREISKSDTEGPVLLWP